MGKLLEGVKEIEAYIGMNIERAIRHGFPIARFGRLYRANSDDIDRHVSVVAQAQKEARERGE